MRVSGNTSTRREINGMNHLYYESRYQECMDGAMRNDKKSDGGSTQSCVEVKNSPYDDKIIRS